jgi:rubrerythrin
MSIFDEIGRRIVETGQNAAQKTRGLSDTMKLNSMISEEERSIKNAFYQIGKKYCELFGKNPDQNFVQLISEIRDSMEKIQEYTDHIKQIKGIVSCSSCGCEVSHESSFCDSCGAPMYSFQAPSSGSESSVYCGDCGTLAEPDAAFCMGCGCKV